MSRPMSLTEFANLVNHIQQFNAPLSGTHPAPVVKYIDPVMDMRSRTVFSITFRTMGGGEKNFHCQNECRDLSASLYDRCMTYLKGLS